MQVDAAAMHFVNQFANRSSLFDLAARYVQGTPMVKGVVIFAFVYWVLLDESRYPAVRRNELLTVVVTCAFALVAARVLASALPFRLRPIHDPALGFVPAYGFTAPALDGWSSFPSDHAVMYAMLACGIGFVSARLGWLAAGYVLVFILFPRVYLGLHWPSDIAAGAALGVAFAYVAKIPRLRDGVGSMVAALRARAPGAFHAGLFVWAYLLATHFDELRRAGSQMILFVRRGAP